jgi:hypothetical protein
LLDGVRRIRYGFIGVAGEVDVDGIEVFGRAEEGEVRVEEEFEVEDFRS